ncbi:hypothetical protein ANN_02416 [Periplaneta americana]|uniref:Uncharacterized protein n=1 Tax=Periplaneta americana TaxID=6978 RepID=A0ABQ8TXV7_PERAM|nr:hypothetical protein ANN_02416 [Periplaneta americana]
MMQRINETPSTPVTERLKQKWKSILCKNNGYGTLCNINSKLLDIESSKNKGLSLRDYDDVRFFRFAPITSCDVERSFLQYKLRQFDDAYKSSFSSSNRNIESYKSAFTRKHPFQSQVHSVVVE